MPPEDEHDPLSESYEQYKKLQRKHNDLASTNRQLHEELRKAELVIDSCRNALHEFLKWHGSRKTRAAQLYFGAVHEAAIAEVLCLNYKAEKRHIHDEPVTS